MQNVSVEKLCRIVELANDDARYAERLFRDPDAIASEHGLSPDERQVIRQMNREQFEAARRDAQAEVTKGELTEADLESVVGGVFSFSPAAFKMFTSMVVGRSIIGATGGSYQNVAAGCDCCAWKGGSIGAALILPAD